MGDNSDQDDDGDGVLDLDDAYPSDPNESNDSDCDGVGDNADPDDDGHIPIIVEVVSIPGRS